MSHLTTVSLDVQDLDAMKEAAANIGLEGNEQTRFAWFGSYVGDSPRVPGRTERDYNKCVLAFKVPGTRPTNGYSGPYEIGVDRAANGDGYQLLYDSWGPGRKLEEVAGVGLTRLKQEYAAVVALKKAKTKLARQGFTATRENLPNGRIRLRLRRR